MSNFVFVLDTEKRPLDPIHPGTARHLLNTEKAAVFRRFPFTIILKLRLRSASTVSVAEPLKEACPENPVQDLELKLDPGSKVTGIVIKQGNKIIFGAELQHRGQQIKDALLSRRHKFRKIYHCRFSNIRHLGYDFAKKRPISR